MRVVVVALMLFINGISVLDIAAQPKRIITLSGALSETVYALGLGANIVAVDVTSEYPEDINRKPRVSKDRNISLEGLLAFKPDLIIAPPAEMNKATEDKLKQLGIKVQIIGQEYSVKGAQHFIKQVGAVVNRTQAANQLAGKINTYVKTALSRIKTDDKKPKVLFIYAQGVGVMSVAGKGSQLDAIINLAGGRNAVQEFNDFKPYSTEALIKSNPDVLLLFDFGASSLGGKNAVLRMPGVAMTNAGKAKRIVTMNGPLLTNFSTRLPQAIQELNKQLYSTSKN